MSSSTLVAELNSEAIKYLQEGNYRAAVWSLDMAAGRLRAGVFDDDEEDAFWRKFRRSCRRSVKSDNLSACAEEILGKYSMKGSTRRRSCNSTDSDGLAPLECLAISREQDSSMSEGVASLQASGNIFEFYPRAFLIHGNSDMRQNATQFFVVITYNMALAYHYEGIRKGRSSMFLKAQELYSRALSVMNSSWHEAENDGLLLLLALSNNLGHVHSHLLNFQETRDSMQSVRELMSASKGFQTSVLSDDDYVFFLTTVVVFDGQELAFAPAA